MAKIIDMAKSRKKPSIENAGKSCIACTTPQESKTLELLNKDTLELKSIPFKDVSKRFYKVVIDFTLIKNDTSRQQFRDLLFSIFCREIPYKRASDRIYYVLRLAGFMSNLDGITEIPDNNLRDLFNKLSLIHIYKAVFTI